MASPTEGHVILANHALRYIIATKDMGMRFGGIPSNMSTSRLQLTASSDSDFAGDNTDFKSTTGVVFQLNHVSTVHWICQKQRHVAIDSTDAEIVAQVAMTKDAYWLTGLMADLGHIQDTIVCDVDNSASVKLAMEDIGMSSTKSRHASVRKAYVREGVRNQITALRHVNGSDNASDIFTKPLNHGPFSQHRASLLGRESDGFQLPAKRARHT